VTLCKVFTGRKVALGHGVLVLFFGLALQMGDPQICDDSRKSLEACACTTIVATWDV
jgi:hypothetical protein